jgi:acetyl esterase/lipase
MRSKSKSFNIYITLFLKYSLEYIPVLLLGKITRSLRNLIRSALPIDTDTKFPVIISSPCAEYDVLSYRRSRPADSNSAIGSVPAARANDIILYLHGGGFAIIDNTDILLCPTLFPVLTELLGYQPPSIYTVRYSFTPVHNETNTFTRIQKEVYDAFKSLSSQGKNIVAVSGRTDRYILIVAT